MGSLETRRNRVRSKRMLSLRSSSKQKTAHQAHSLQHWSLWSVYQSLPDKWMLWETNPSPAAGTGEDREQNLFLGQAEGWDTANGWRGGSVGTQWAFSSRVWVPSATSEVVLCTSSSLWLKTSRWHPVSSLFRKNSCLYSFASIFYFHTEIFSLPGIYPCDVFIDDNELLSLLGSRLLAEASQASSVPFMWVELWAV